MFYRVEGHWSEHARITYQPISVVELSKERNDFDLSKHISAVELFKKQNDFDLSNIGIVDRNIIRSMDACPDFFVCVLFFGVSGLAMD
jgi:hypothetical protein